MASGNFTGTTSVSYISLYCEWRSTPNATANNSSVTVDVYLNHKALSISSKSGNISINGSSSGFSSSAISQSSTASARTKIGTKTVTVAHNENGSKTCALSVSFDLNATIGGKYIGKITASTTATLDTIARASTISATNADVESACNITVSRKSTSYTHTIKYAVGSLSGYITANGSTTSTATYLTATSINFTIPSTVYAQFPNSKTITIALTCTTYSGTYQIGSPHTVIVTLTANPNLCSPTVSGTVTDSNSTTVALTGDSSKLIKGYSIASCTITATAKNSASIASKKINNTAVSGNTLATTAVSDTYTFNATDSRGYSGSATVKATLIQYIGLTCNATAIRPIPTDGSAKLTLSGNYWNGNFGKIANTLTVQYRYAEEGRTFSAWKSVTATKSNGTWSAIVNLEGFDYSKSFVFEIKASDQLVSLTKEAPLIRGKPVFDWGKDDFNVDGIFKIQESPVTDFITETGTSSNWYYEKYASGIVKCYWQLRDYQVSINQLANGAYTSGAVSVEVPPFNYKKILYLGEPLCTLGAANWAVIDLKFSSITDVTKLKDTGFTVHFHCDQSFTNLKVQFSYMFIAQL